MPRVCPPWWGKTFWRMKVDFKPSENTWLKTILSHRLSKNEVCTQWYVHSLLYKMQGTAQFISSKAELPGKWSGSCTLVASKDKITIRTMRACVGSEDKISQTFDFSMFWIFVTTQLDFRLLLRQFIAVWRPSTASGKPGFILLPACNCNQIRWIFIDWRV